MTSDAQQANANEAQRDAANGIHIWSPTCELRNYCFGIGGVHLQQLWRSHTGREEWRAVPTVIEMAKPSGVSVWPYRAEKVR